MKKTKPIKSEGVEKFPSCQFSLKKSNFAYPYNEQWKNISSFREEDTKRKHSLNDPTTKCTYLYGSNHK